MFNNPAQLANPYPFYHTVRCTTPIYQDKNGTWHFTRYADVKFLFSDDFFSRRAPESSSYIHQNKKHLSESEKIINQWILFNDASYHTKLRKNLSPLFHPAFIKEMCITIEAIAEELMTNLLTQKTADFMQAFAYPLPVRVLNAILGTNLDISVVRKWSLALVKALDCGASEDFLELDPTIVEMQKYFVETISLYQDKNSYKSNNWIAKLMHSNAADPLHFEEIVATCIFLLLAGHETVHLTLGLGLRAFLKNPDQIELLQQNPALTSSAIEEILRFETAPNKISRWTRKEITIDGISIPANELVVGLLNSANHDPLKFEKPEQFNIMRMPNQHLSFGFGIHSCLGAMLARTELNVAFGKLTPHLHKFALAENEEEWLTYSAFRYLFKLMIKIQ